MASVIDSMAGRLRASAARAWLSPGTARLRGAPAGAVDAALGGAFLVVMLAERAGEASATGALLPVTVLLSAAIAGGLVLRRRAPVTGYLVGTAALAAESLLVQASPVSPFANLIGLYSLGLYAAGARAWWGPVLVLPGVTGYYAGLGSGSLAAPAGTLISWLLVWALGYSTARRRAEQKESQRLLNQQAIAAERTRIARELHDLVGHTVNLMLVQAGAARRMLDRDPLQSRELLVSVEKTGRDALAELDRVLGVLRRHSPAEPDATDEPGLANLPRLLQRMAHAGIEVTADVDPDPAQLPRSLSLTAYRIIQEALTNTLKHGRARTASVTVRIAAGALDIEVRDDGRGVAQGYVPGRGLLGIRERAALFGGSVEHGGGERGGFRLRAALPLP